METPTHQYVTLPTSGVPIKAWIKDVRADENAIRQLQNVASLPIVKHWVAAMPDVHFGIGATVGSVIPTVHAIIPAAVGVDIGCGMMAARTTWNARDLPDDLRPMRAAIEDVVPHGFSHHGGRHASGSWRTVPGRARASWKELSQGYQRILEMNRKLDRGNCVEQLGTLGGGNHFIEVCLGEDDSVWILLHSGSRGVGNRIGQHFIELARNEMRGAIANLPDKDLAYLQEGSRSFDDYVFAVEWAQQYARTNREIMMSSIVEALQQLPHFPEFKLTDTVVNCHHNYVRKEVHFGVEVFLTRKGAVRAGKGEYGIIPGSMGARSYIVRGKGNPQSFESCSHGAGRNLSRNEAKRRFTVADHIAATKGVECRKDSGVINETPMAYKDIDKVMEAQSDLVEIAHTLKQVVCVKG